MDCIPLEAGVFRYARRDDRAASVRRPGGQSTFSAGGNVNRKKIIKIERRLNDEAD